jgi:hypothetical protein
VSNGVMQESGRSAAAKAVMDDEASLFDVARCVRLGVDEHVIVAGHNSDAT